MKKTRRGVWGIPLLLALSAGCIVHDQQMALILNPDGSGDVFITRSNIRSLARGRDAEAQIEEYRAAFDARTEDMLWRIQDAEARLETAVWVRREAPMATLVHAVIPDAETLERLAAFRDDEGVFVLRPAFSRSENRRRLTLELNVPPDQIPSWAGEAEALERMQAARADAFSDYRIAVAAGTISDAAGFRVAGDRRSAVPDEAAVLSLLRTGGGRAELFVEWEVEDPDEG